MYSEKLLAFVTWCWFSMAAALAQNTPIGPLRPLDDNHALAADSSDWRFHRIIKELTPARRNPGTLLSFGGEIREQIRYFNHINFGDVDSGIKDHDVYLQQRFLLHANLRINKTLRFFVQFNSCHATGKDIIVPQVDRDDLGVMQAFGDLEVTIPFPLRLRLGRQEFMYGLERFLALRDGPTIRQTFDGARLTLGLKKATGDFFLVVPVSYQFGVFDNTWRENEYVLATYWTMPVKENNFMDLYFFSSQVKEAIYAHDTADENRQSLGFRLRKSTGAFGYDAEFTYQFGKHGSNDIHAWHLSSQFAYRWQSFSWKPRLMIRQAFFSGDRKPGDGIINTFRPVTAKPPVYDLVPLGPANLAMISPEAEILLHKTFMLTLRYFWVWRLSENDGLYPPDMRKMSRDLVSPGGNQGSTDTRGIALDISYTPNKHFNVLLYGGLFLPGDYIRSTGEGKNVEACSLKITYKF
jgi:hypothetical protein